MARTATTTALFVNAIIKKLGIKNAELQEALVEAGMGYAAAQLFQSEGAGTAGGGAGNGDVNVPETPSDRGDSESGHRDEAGNGQESTTNGNIASGNGSASSGSGTGDVTEGPEAAANQKGG